MQRPFMKVKTLHSWNITPREAISLQKKLARRVVAGPRLHRKSIRLIGGADLSIHPNGREVYAGVVILSFPDLEIVETVGIRTTLNFPYVPGLLTIREAPALLLAFERLRGLPQLVFIDGQGIAHPRGFGLACHIGLSLNLPVIGCAKSILVGEGKNPGPLKGDKALLRYGGKVVGTALRTRNKVRPVYVSIGHKIDLTSAVRFSLICSRGFRVPEPTRQADLLVGRLRRDGL